MSYQSFALPIVIFSLLLPGCAINKELWEHVITVKAQDNTSTPTGFHSYTVPSDKNLVITDVVMTHNINTTTNTFRTNIRRGPSSNGAPCQTAGLVLGPYVRPNETVSINLSTGVLYNAGDQLCIAIGGTTGSNQGVTHSFTGYFK